MDLGSLAIHVARSENLPVLPQIVTAINKLADDPNASSRSMETLIERDPAISAKLLKVSNSTYYGIGNVSSIGRAITVLGMNTVRSLVVSIAYQQVTSSRPTSQRFSISEFWMHSMAAATAARILGRLKDPIKAEELYSAALMHDVGLLVFDRFVTEQLDSALLMAQDQGVSLFDAEKALLGFDHIEAGQLLAKKWGLSGMIIPTLEHLSTPMLIPEELQHVHLLVAADYVADRCGFQNNSRHTPELNMVTEDFLGLPEGQLEIIIDVVRNEVEKASEVFQARAA